MPKLCLYLKKWSKNTSYLCNLLPTLKYSIIIFLNYEIVNIVHYFICFYLSVIMRLKISTFLCMQFHLNQVNSLACKKCRIVCNYSDLLGMCTTSHNTLQLVLVFKVMFWILIKPHHCHETRKPVSNRSVMLHNLCGDWGSIFK